jgi:hypothetical protein
MNIIIIVLKFLKKTGGNVFPYIKQKTLFTPAERSFPGVLTQVVENCAVIFGKVRIADVVRVKKGLNRSSWRTAFNKIQSKHLDFLICDKNDLSILGVIELHDSSHNKTTRKKRDAVPYIETPAKRHYALPDIEHQLNGVILENTL